MKRICTLAVFATTFFFLPGIRADEIRVDIQNTAPGGGFFFTPVFLAFSDGSFDAFDSGGTASAELTILAEEGNTAPIANLLATQQATSQSVTVLGNSTGPPPFDPGETISSLVNVNTSTQRFLTYLSMIIPSNDAFFGNADALEIFDVNGDFLGPQTIEITAGMIYDAGTEVNDINGGAAFSANGGTSVDENNPISLIDLAELNNFIGTGTASGATIGSGFSPSTIVARISISLVPEPGSSVALVLVGLAAMARRKRK